MEKKNNENHLSIPKTWISFPFRSLPKICPIFPKKWLKKWDNHPSKPWWFNQFIDSPMFIPLFSHCSSHSILIRIPSGVINHGVLGNTQTLVRWFSYWNPHRTFMDFPACHVWWHRMVTISGWWFFATYPSEKWWTERQLGWHFPFPTVSGKS